MRMSAVFDQADDSEIYTWGPARLRTVMAAFKAGNDGEDAEPDEEASADQLAALEHRLLQGGCPSPDFGVWRPYGQRLARQLRLVVHHITPGGDYVPYEVPGPPSFAEWLAAYKVFSMAMRALEAATHTRLLLYQNKIQRLNDVYGHVCWWLVAQADQRMRGEHLCRIRRRAEEGKLEAEAAGRTFPLDANMPWDYCLKLAAADRDFWGEELDKKCTLYITHLKTQRQLLDQGHGAVLPGIGGDSGSRSSGQASHPRQTQGGAGQTQGGGSRGKKRPNQGKTEPERSTKGASRGKAKHPDGRHRVDEHGKDICWLWNHSDDGCADICHNGRAHVCEWCRQGDHRSVNCKKKPKGWTPRPL